MPEGYRLGWSYIPHFIHVRFYTYAYAFAQLVALLLYRAVSRGSRGVRAGVARPARGRRVRVAGGSARAVGVDLRSTETWREAFAELDALREEAETLSSGVPLVASSPLPRDSSCPGRDDDRLLLDEVTHGDAPFAHLRQRAVAAVGGQPGVPRTVAEA